MQFIRPKPCLKKLGLNHASKDEIGLAVFGVFRELRLAVRDLGLLLVVRGSESFLERLLVHVVSYGTTIIQSFTSKEKEKGNLIIELESENGRRPG